MNGIFLVFFAPPRSLRLGGVQQLPVDSAGVSRADLRHMGVIWLGQSPRRWFCVEFLQPGGSRDLLTRGSHRSEQVSGTCPGL